MRGLSKPAKHESGDGSYFERRLAEAARPEMEPDDWDALRRVRHECALGITAGRRGAAFESGRHFDRALKLGRSCRSDLPKALCTTFTQSAIAAWDATQMRFEKAEKRLRVSYLIDEQIVNESRLKVMGYHQLQSIHNRARLFFKSGRSEAWAFEVSRLLAFTWRGSPDVDLDVGWSTCRFAQLQDTVQTDIFSRQVLADVAHVMFSRLSCSTACLRSLLDFATGCELPNLEKSLLPFYERLLNWGVYDDALAADILEAGRPNSARLAAWDAVALETVDHLGREDSKASLELTTLFEAEVKRRGGSASWVLEALRMRIN